MRDAYRSLCAELFADPFDLAVVEKIGAALDRQEPFSVVRIGDGEANILAFGHNRSTPTLDRHAFEKSLAKQADTFQVNELWMLVLRDLMANAVVTADIVGALGVWMPDDQPGNTNDFVRHFRREIAAMAGQWQGRDVMLRWARKDMFQRKTLGSAHLYLGLVTHVDELVAHAKMVVCLSDRGVAVNALRAKHGGRAFVHIPVGRSGRKGLRSRTEPDFLLQTQSALPDDLRGCLCLVGAGPWAELYCMWIKQRGGVAVDLGSGFDLLEGKMTRSIHKVLPHRTRDQLMQDA